MAQRAVLLVNLGSPKSTRVEDVREYLHEFLMDGRVLDAPYPIRWFVVNRLILPRRPRESAEAYGKIWTAKGSPLIVTSQQQQHLLNKEVDVPVYLAMRYGTPAIGNTLAQMARDGVEHALVIPLYPHYAMSSYETVATKVEAEAVSNAPTMTLDFLKPFYNDPGYIDALYESARPYLDPGDFDKLLFSFHGVPERHIRKGDPSGTHCLQVKDCCRRAHPSHAFCYRHQCFETARLLAERAGIPEERTFVSFQSRLGRDPWLRPYTDKTLEAFPAEGVKRVKVMCPAFVSDCLETLEEIAMQGREGFIEAGGESFEQIPCMNDHPAWIAYLQSRVEAWLGATMPVPAQA